MGMNAEIAIEFIEPVTAEIIKKIQYAILCRLGNWTINDDGFFIVPSLENCSSQTWEFNTNETFGHIKLDRFYNKDYPSGNAIVYIITMLILVRSPYVKNVYYVPEGQNFYAEDISHMLYTEEKVISLLKDFIDFGFERESSKQNRENSNNPVCPFCEEKMETRGYYGSNREMYECAGCKSTITLTGDELMRYKNGQEYNYTEVIDERRNKVYDAHGKFLRPIVVKSY